MQLILKKPIDRKKSVKNIKEPVKYLPVNFGFHIPNVNPSNVKIAILDTGVPAHSDMSNIGGHSELSFVDLLSSKSTVWDEHGHATIVTGILAGSNPGTIMGMAPSARYYFCKVMDDFGDGDTNNLTAGIIWSIANNVDIILICAGSPIHDRYLEKVIKKAVDVGCIVIASSGKEVTRGNKILYPAAFDGVICCSSSKDGSCEFVPGKNKLYVDTNASNSWSTFPSDSYMKASGSSMAASIVCGCSINLLGDCRMRNIPINSVADFMQKMEAAFKGDSYG